MKINVYISDDGWEGLKQLGYEKGYIRGASADDRPRGMSHFVGMLATHKWKDARPEWMQGTGQWMSGTQRAKQRCLYLSAAAIADLGLTALEHAIYPYRSQLPVVNGYKRDADLPQLHGVGEAPRGAASIAGLAGPVLDAIGLRHLQPVVTLPQAPPNLYQAPSVRYKVRDARRRAKHTVM